MLTEKEKENFFKNMDIVTIVPDRYGGTFSGGRWLAFELDHWDLVDLDFDASDLECRDFWDHYDGVVGKGDTPNDALLDLAEILKSKGVTYFFE